MRKLTVLAAAGVAVGMSLQGALCNLSREKAQMAVKSGIVELDYEAVEDCSATVDAPAVISVRGFGKFAVHAFDGTTRKGRIRLVAGKYV